MSDILPLPQDVRIAAFPFLAESIELAHKYAPARWGLSPHTSDGFIRLNVVMTEVLTIDANSVRVFVNEAVANSLKDQLTMVGSDDDGDYYNSSPGSRLVEIARGPQQAELLALLLPAHAENVRLTAKRGGIGRGVRSAHSDDAIKELSLFLRQELPLPLYSYDQRPELNADALEARLEGAEKEVVSKRRERNAKNRQNAVQIHGVTCQACGFNFETIYGEHGFGYIEVHHNAALSKAPGEILVDPREDLAVVCANCHVMLHRDRKEVLSLRTLKEIINPKFPASLKSMGGK